MIVRKKHIKVANIILDPRLGGPQRRILQIAEVLGKKNIETIVITNVEHAEVLCREAQKRDNSVKLLPLHRIRKDKRAFLLWILMFVPELWALHRFLKKKKIQLVHANSPWQYKGILAAKLAGAKVVWHINDTAMPELLKFVFKLVGRSVDCFIVAGERVRAYHLAGSKLDSQRVVEIQAPVDTKVFDPAVCEPAKDIAGRKGIKVLTMGTINPTKCIEDFLHIAKEFNSFCTNINFFVAGAPLNTQMTYLRFLLELKEDLGLNNLYFLGERLDIPEVLAACDIYVCTSLSEASPMAVWEALSMGMPVVSTDVGDVKRFVRHGENGFVVKAYRTEELSIRTIRLAKDAIRRKELGKRGRNAAEMAQRVLQLVNDKALRIKFGESGRKRAINELDIEICAEKHFRLYKELVEGRSYAHN
jgi:glycosyltransferase involved in cell wall biosynthesis